MRVRLTKRAHDDLSAALAYLAQRSTSGARNVGGAIKATIDLVGRHPGLGAPSGEPGTRVLPIGQYPYLIYWQVAASEVVIVHIRHAARQRL